jgi:amino acid adenylation domain-containing protein
MPATGEHSVGAERYRLSPRQRALWQAAFQRGGSRVAVWVELDHAVPAAALERALYEVATEHEATRLAFERDTVGGEPLQLLMEEPALEWLGGATAGTGGDETERSGLWQPPILACLSERPGRRPLLHLEHSLLASDRRSLEILAALAFERATGTSDGSELGAIEHLQVSQWLLDNLESGVGSPDEAYWRAKAERAGALDHPLLRSAPAGGAARRARLACPFPAGVPDALLETAEKLGVDAEGMLLACLHALLLRLGGVDRCEVGVVGEGRLFEVLEQSLGPLALCLPSLCEQGDTVACEELVTAVARQRREDLSRADGYALLAAADTRRPQFGFECAFQPSGGVQARATRLVRFEHRPRDFGLKLDCVWREGAFALELDFDPARLDPRRAASVRDSLALLVQAIVQRPSLALREIDPIGAREYELLAGCSGTPVSPASEERFEALFAEQVAKQPDAAALVCEGARLRYRELDEWSSRLSRILRARQLVPEDRIAVVAERSLEFIVSVLAAFKVGCPYVPLDPDQPLDHLRRIVADSRARILLASGDGTRIAPELGLDALDVTAAREADAPEIQIPAVREARGLAYVIYTSGSTGTPKGIAIEHAQLVGYVRGLLGRHPQLVGLRFATASSPATDLGNTAIFASLASGGCAILASRGAARDADAFAAFLSASSCECLKIAPAHLHALLECDGPARALPSRCLLLGGESPSPDLLRRIRELAPDLQVISHYGPTETCIGVVTGSLAPGAAGDVECRSIGVPLPGSRAFVLDARMRLVPFGAVGELCIGGNGLARGYWNGPEATAERFVPDPLSGVPGARLYRSGDLVRHLDDGRLEFVGRCDDQLKIRGYRVEPGEVAQRMRRIDAVAAAEVIAVETAGSDRELVAFVVLRTGRAASPAALRDRLSGELPEHLVPARILLVDAIPRGPSGKVDRRALLSFDRCAAGSLVARPATDTERRVLEVWQGVLGHSAIGLDQDFFEVGGHSLLAIQLLARLRKTFGSQLGLRALLERRTVSGLASLIEASARAPLGDSPPAPSRAGEAGPWPVSFGQRQLYVLDRFERGSALYNVPIATRVAGAVDARALEAALAALLHRHEGLRSRFVVAGGELMQEIDHTPAEALRVLDLRMLASDRVDALVSRWAARPFDLERGRLARFLLLRTAEREHVFLAAFHHAVIDGWSLRILARELSELYGRAFGREPSPLPGLPIRQRDYAAWQQERLAGPLLERLLTFWEGKLAELPPPLDLALDRPRPPRRGFRGEQLQLTLPAGLRKSLHLRSAELGATPFLLSLAAFYAFLFQYTQEDDLIVGTPVSGRDEIELEGVVGYFVNTLALRVRVEPRRSFAELLQAVKETVLEAHEHQALPFELLVERINPVRAPDRHELAQVIFQLQPLHPAGGLLPGAVLEPLAARTGTAKFDLGVCLVDTGDGLLASIEWDSELFERETIERMACHYVELLRVVLDDPKRPLGDLWPRELVERIASCGAALEPSGQRAVHEQVREIARLFPDSPAIRFERRAMSYAELVRMANGVARLLREDGVEPEEIVCVVLERSPEAIASLLGILEAGAAFLPVDPAEPAARAAPLLTAGRVRRALTSVRHAGEVAARGLRPLVIDGEPRSWSPSDESPGEDRLDGERLAYVMPTSGSTGRPKGVMVRHSSLAATIASARTLFGIERGSRVLQYALLSFDASLWQIFPTLTAGAELVVVSDELRLSVSGLEALIDREQLDVVELPPVVLRLLDADRLRGVRTVATGGERVSRELADRWAGPARRFINAYGPTETTIGCTALDCRISYAKGPPIGRPLSGVRLWVADAQGAPQPAGIPGELLIGGGGVARGYLGDPAQTAERFIPDAASELPGARAYRTGDLVRERADGDFEFLRRCDEQLKIKGLRIEPGEVVRALERLPGVREAAVVAREIGAGAARLVAYLVLEPGRTLERSSLREGLRGVLPYYMIPAAFVQLDALPRAAGGKLLASALPAQGEIPLPGAAAGPSPRTPSEMEIAQLWARVLSLGREPRVHENFFEVGGDSLLGIQLLNEIRRRFGVEVSIRRLFDEPTIERLSELVIDAQLDAAQPEDVLEALERVSLLSDAEVSALLREPGGTG